jgi:phytoene dehydrogenase-like protein
MVAPRTAIVIGGGPAGLAAACRLSEGGMATTLLEAKASVGGRAASEHREGFDLNQGPHALYVGGSAMRALRAMGIDPPLWNPLSSSSVFVRGGKVTRRPGGSFGLLRWLAEVARCHPGELSDLSVAEWLRQDVSSERARAAAAALVRVTTFVADHDALSADVAATQVKLGLFPGVRYVRGGWQWLVDALAAKAESHNATVRTRAGARSVRRVDGRWQLTLDEEVLHADVLVVATGGPDAFARLLHARAPSPPGPAAELSVLDLGLRTLPRRRTFALGIDTPTYLAKHSPPRHRDGVLLSLAGYAREPRARLEEMAEVVQPGWREQVTLQRFLPRMVAVSALPSPESGGLAGRPSVDRGEGLFLAGDWFGPQGWLVDAAISSGVAAATAALSKPDRETAMAA